MNVGGVGSAGGASVGAVGPAQQGAGTGEAVAGSVSSMEGVGVGQQSGADNSSVMLQGQDGFISTQDQIGLRSAGAVGAPSSCQSGQMDMDMQFMIKMMMMLMLMKMMQDLMQGNSGGFSAIA